MAKLGLFYIAACEGLLSFVLGLYSIFCFAIPFLKHLRSKATSPHLYIAGGLAFGVTAAFCFYSATALLKHRRWAWYVAWMWGLPMLAFGGWILEVVLDDRKPYTLDPSYGVFAGVIILFFAIVGLVVLSLPSIRRLLLGRHGD